MQANPPLPQPTDEASGRLSVRDSDVEVEAARQAYLAAKRAATDRKKAAAGNTSTATGIAMPSRRPTPTEDGTCRGGEVWCNA